jgi:medium-chain acyl-[acyl-carrier-protein] hydrolase
VQGSWIVRRQPRPHARYRLICFPHAGGGPAVFRTWQAGFPEQVEVLAAQLPGREARFRERPVESVADMVEQLERDVSSFTDLPFVLFGHSMGALLAYEVARRLMQRGNPAPHCLIVSARRAPAIQERDEPLHVLDDAAFIGEIQRRYGGIPDEVLRHPDLLQLLLPTLRADIGALERHEHVPGEPLECPIVALGGADDPRVRPADLAPWRQETRLGFACHVLPGGHFFINGAAARVCDLVTGALAVAPATAVA